MHNRLLLTMVLAGGMLGSVAVAEESRQRSPEQRIQHLREAAEHLDLAGLNREAKELRGQAEKIEADWRRDQREHESHAQHPRNPTEGHQDVLQHLHELHHSIEGLRKEVRELREQMHSKPHPAPNFDEAQHGPIFRYIPGPDGPVFKQIPNPWDLNMPAPYSVPKNRVDPAPPIRADEIELP